ncbi:FaeA/PapI family transcriptional regulator [Serratia fonticola]|uniref:FaeA/PapI family transcriptional regulator n=1 Tax=Serratia fonticola TaxID=47917 RepID=UPI003AAC455B
MTGYKKRAEELNQVLAALQNLSPPNAACNEEMWPKTRHIAEVCNIDIYISRYYLMKLVKDKKALVSSKSISNSLRWYLPPLSPPLYSDESDRVHLNKCELICHDIQKGHAIRNVK